MLCTPAPLFIKYTRHQVYSTAVILPVAPTRNNRFSSKINRLLVSRRQSPFFRAFFPCLYFFALFSAVREYIYSSSNSIRKNSRTAILCQPPALSPLRSEVVTHRRNSSPFPPTVYHAPGTNYCCTI